MRTQKWLFCRLQSTDTERKNNFLKNIETTLTIKLQSQSKYLAHLIAFSPSHFPWASHSAVSRRQRT